MPTLDPKILSQLLTIQNFFLIMPTDQKLAEFFLSSLSKFPGIKNRYLCTEFTNGPTGGAFSHCRDCPVYLREEIDPSYHPCLVPPQNTMRIYSLDTIDRFYGYLLVEVQSKEQYDLYEPYVLNLCNTFILIHKRKKSKPRWMKPRPTTALWPITPMTGNIGLTRRGNSFIPRNPVRERRGMTARNFLRMSICCIK